MAFNSECRGDKGLAVLEFAIVSALLVFFCAVAIEFGFAFYIYQAMQSSAREGARIAATLPNLQEDDARVVNEITARLNAGGFANYAGNFSPTNTVPTSVEGIVNNAGLPCDQEITVTVQADASFKILRMFGFTTLPLSRSVTMRYQVQPICS